MTEKQSIRYGITFGVSLAMSLLLTNALFAMALWRLRDQPANRLLALGSLWLFTVVAPTTTAVRLHRRLQDLVAASPNLPAGVTRDIASLRSLLLIFGTMAMLSAFTLLLGP
jgi:hypothetical protein